MAKASDNPYPSILVAETAAPTSPAAGNQRIFIDPADHKLKRINSSGAVTIVEGGGATSFSGAKVYFSGATSVASGSVLTLGWTAEEFDTGTYHDNVTNNSRLTAPTTGYYVVGYDIAISTNVTTSCRVLGTIYKNGDNSTGTPVRGTRSEQDAAGMASANPAVNAQAVVSLTAGDYVTFGMYQNSGSTLSFDLTLCAFWAYLIGT